MVVIGNEKYTPANHKRNIHERNNIRYMVLVSNNPRIRKREMIQSKSDNGIRQQDSGFSNFIEFSY